MISFLKKLYHGDCKAAVEFERDLANNASKTLRNWIQANSELTSEIDKLKQENILLKIELEKEKEKVKRLSAPDTSDSYVIIPPAMPPSIKDFVELKRKETIELIEQAGGVNDALLGSKPSTETVKVRPLFNKIQPENEWPHKKKKHKGK